MKKGLKIGAASLAALMVFGVAGCGKDKDPKLPTARIDECNSNDYSATCSGVTADNLHEYLGRDDVMYVDLRNFGDYSKSHLDGFDMVQFFANIYGKEDQLFIQETGDKNYMPRYKDSVKILETIFPKDKTIFFMCQSGGRVVHMMKIMELNGWDMSRIYNVGGMGTYGQEKHDAKYGDIIVTGSYSAAELKTGVHTDGTYKTVANVAVDANGKITQVYVTGTEYTATAGGTWTPETWIEGKYDLTASLVGKTLNDVKALLNNEGKATGADVVTGATVTTTRVYKAVIAALEA